MDLETLYEKIAEAPKALTALMENLEVNNKKAFKQVLRGFPENGIGSYGGDIGVSSLKKIKYEDDFDDQSIPESLIFILAIVCKGTKTQVHDKVTKLTLDVSKKIEDDLDWFTLNDNVSAMAVIDHEIFIERNKNSLLTSSVFELECSLDFHENPGNNTDKKIDIEEGIVSFDD